ncbi:MAG: protoporphyrinogen oxidase [Chloroflexi bacterium]|nr:protoporphyrinogen oxidase [Chloroflexota bacterium]
MAPDHAGRTGRAFSVVIVGGGITGLAAAWYLEGAWRQSGTDLSIVLVERENVLGGKLSTLREDGFVVEGGPDGFLTRKPWALELANELGIGDDVVYMQTTGALLQRRGRLHPIPPGLMGPAPADRRDIWDASFLSWQGKLRASLEPLVRKRTAAGRESLGSFLRRRLGSELTDTLLEPMMAGIYGSDSYDMSLDALFPMLGEWERRYGSLSRGMREARKAAQGSEHPPSAFFSLAGGTRQLVEAMVQGLERTEIVSGSAAVAVDRVEDEEPRFAVTMDGGRSFKADAAVLATPAWDAGSLVGSFAPGLAGLLGRMRGAPAVSVCLALARENVDHPLDGSGFLSPRSEAGPVAGCTWLSSKWPGRSPRGHVLLRVFLHTEDSALGGLSDAALAETACEALRPLLGIRGAAERSWVHRWADGLPQYKVDHTEWLDDVERETGAHPGLFLCGASYRGIGVPDCVRQARDAAERVHAFATHGAGQGSAQAART